MCFSLCQTSSEHPATASSVVPGNGNWDGAGGMDQITVVRIDDTHIAGEQSHAGGKLKDGAAEFYELVEYSVPAEEEVVLEDDDDDVFVIEYSNPEEEGESYKFRMSVDKKTITGEPVVRESVRAPRPARLRPRHEARLKRKLIREEEVLSNKSVLELGENYSDTMEMSSGPDKRLVCSLCPPPGRFFKRGAGLAAHLKQLHHVAEKKRFFCTTCRHTVRSQVELDAHTKRHAHQDAVFTCHLCPPEAGFKGTKLGLKQHLEKEHPGVIPRCDICNKSFKLLSSYLADQFRHVGKSPYFCAKCQIYEMTERGLTIHKKNDDKKTQRQSGDDNLQAPGVPAVADNSATDDSDF